MHEFAFRHGQRAAAGSDRKKRENREEKAQHGAR
jgi:hypothetical protein